MLTTPHLMTSRRAAAAALTVALGLGLVLGPATGAGATSVPDDGDGSGVVLLDAGDSSHRVVLPGTPQLGASGVDHQVTHVSGTIVSSGSSDESVTIDVVTTIVQSGEVVSVAPDGGFVILRRVESYDVVDNSDEGQGKSYAADPELADVLGLDLEFTYAAGEVVTAGVPAAGVTLTAAQQAALDEMIAQRSAPRFPAEPVGTGARWIADISPSGNGEVTATYTLVSLEGEDFTIEVAMKGDAAASLGGALPEGFDSASGAVTGTARLVGHVGDPFDRQSEVTTEVDIVLTGPGIEVTTDITLVETGITVAG